MTPLLIQNALVKFLQHHLEMFQMDAPDGNPRPPQIFMDALQPASSQRDEDVYPFIIVRWMEGEDSGNDEDSIETFSLIIGVYGGDEENLHAAAASGQWAMTVVTRLRRLFGENKYLDDRYELQYPLRSKKPAPEKQQNRYLLAVVTTRWSAPALVQTMEG